MPRGFWPLKRRPRMPQLTETGEKYSIWVGCIYIFNLIVGTGALAVPKAFAAAGWLLSTFSLVILATISFITVTYIIETLACANAYLKWQQDQAGGNRSDDEAEDGPTSTDVSEPLVEAATGDPSRYYCLDSRVELGGMANMFFAQVGKILFYLTICVYLFGDLAIYDAAVAKTVMEVICSDEPLKPGEKWLDKACFESSEGVEGAYTRLDVYRLSLLAFNMFVGPFCFFNVQKTKVVQIFSVGMRWIAFALMILIAIVMLITKGAAGSPPAVAFAGLPTLFGSSVYAFTCHHSLPSLLTPISGDGNIAYHLALDYCVICIFYLLLSFTGAFAFAQLYGLYTLNFVPTSDAGWFLKAVEYFLSCFPLFTLSASFPIIAITLRNNLMNLCLNSQEFNTYSFFVRRLLFPLLTILPPVVLTFFFEDITVLIKFTGAYAGSGIQYLIPTFLVIYARQKCKSVIGTGVVNTFRSPFSNHKWAVAVITWSVMCLVLVTVDLSEGL